MNYFRTLKKHGYIFPKQTNLKYLKYLLDLGAHPVVQIPRLNSSNNEIIALSYSSFPFDPFLCLEYIIDPVSKENLKKMYREKIIFTYDGNGGEDATNYTDLVNSLILEFGNVTKKPTYFIERNEKNNA